VEEYYKQNSVKPIKYPPSVGSADVRISVRWANGFVYICWKKISCITMSKQMWWLTTPCHHLASVVLVR